MILFYIGCGLVAITLVELWLSTRKGGTPSSTFWVLVAVSAVVIWVGLTGGGRE